MRRVKLYTLNEQEVLATGDFIEMRRMTLPLSSIMLTDSNEMIALMDETQRLPVHHVYKVLHGVKTDHFIAIDPEVEEIIEARMEAKYEPLRKLHKRLTSDVIHYETRIYEYNSLPWYKRIFKWV